MKLALGIGDNKNWNVVNSSKEGAFVFLLSDTTGRCMLAALEVASMSET
jgi:hypothetical protein